MGAFRFDSFRPVSAHIFGSDGLGPWTGGVDHTGSVALWCTVAALHWVRGPLSARPVFTYSDWYHCGVCLQASGRKHEVCVLL